MSANRIVHFLFGDDEYFLEADYSLLRTLATHDPATGPLPSYLIYTDRPERFDWWRDRVHVDVVPLADELKAAWRGPHDFFWRIKIEMLRHAATNFGGNLLYLDTDCYARRDLTDLFARIDGGLVVMYEDEGPIDRRERPEFWRFHQHYTQHPELVVNGERLSVPLTTRMLNAGVVGLNQANADLLDRALAFCDAGYAEWPSVFMEQFALGYQVQHAPGGWGATTDEVFHYWRVKRFSVLLAEFFACHRAKGIDHMVAASERILPESFADIVEDFNQSRPFLWLWHRFPYRMQRLFPKWADWPVYDYLDRAR